MYCPQCSMTYEQRLQCPGCGVRLNYFEADRRRGFGAFARGWQHTPFGRVFIGLMLAQGLFYGLRHFLTGVLLLVLGQNGVQEALGTLAGLIVVQTLQVVALLLGGLLAGAGQRGGLMLGLVLGVINGAVAVIAQQWPTTATHSFIPIYGQPLIQGAVGAVGGWAGAIIWKPLVVVLGPESARVKRKPVPHPSGSFFVGRIHWFRVLFGGAFSLAGCLSATYLLERVVLAASDSLMTDGYWQEKVVTWEIKALAMLMGGALGGACSSNGFKQGVLVGVFSGGVLSIALATRGANLEALGLTMVSSLCLCLAGGWFGGQLFPPVARFKRQRGMGPASLS
jgi:hypothetical protein